LQTQALWLRLEIYQLKNTLAVSVVGVAAIAVAPASARQGSEDNKTTVSTTESTGSSATSTSGKRSSDAAVATTHTETENETETEHVNGDDNVKTHVSDLRSAAQQLLVAKREDGKTKSVEVRQKACSAHQDELKTRQQNYVRNAQKHLTTFNNIYDKVLAFQADKQLTVNNFDSLKSSADAKKTAASAAVTALSDASITIDCTSTDPAANVATLKTAVSNARTALQDYRTAIKNVIVALQAAKPTSSSTNSNAEAN
jgi:hypothetical protein